MKTKIPFSLRKFIRAGGDLVFTSSDGWLTDTHCAMLLRPGMYMNIISPDSDYWAHYLPDGKLHPFLQKAIHTISPITAMSKWMSCDYGGTQKFIRKIKDETEREAVVNCFYMRVVRDVWPNSFFYLADYPEVPQAPVLIAKEGDSLVGLVMAMVLRDLASPEYVKRLDELEYHFHI